VRLIPAHSTGNGIDLNTVGEILMVIGGVGLVLSLLLWERIGGYGIRRRTVVERSDPYSDTVVDRHDQLL